MAISSLQRAGAAVILLPTGAAAAGPVESQPARVAPPEKGRPGDGGCGGDQDGEEGQHGDLVWEHDVVTVLGSIISSPPGQRVSQILLRPCGTADDITAGSTFSARDLPPPSLRGSAVVAVAYRAPNVSSRASYQFRYDCS